jgi:hypothetical protein
MACCAFVAFLVSQLYVLVEGVARRFGRAPRAKLDSAVMWRLDTNTSLQALQTVSSSAQPLQSRSAIRASSPGGQSRLRAPRRALWLGAFAVEACVLIGGLQWFTYGTGGKMLSVEIHRLLAGESLANLRDLCGLKRSP